MKKYTYDYFWLLLAVFWGGFEGYWFGLWIDKVYSNSITIGMLMISCLTSLSFLFIFLNSKKEIKGE